MLRHLGLALLFALPTALPAVAQGGGDLRFQGLSFHGGNDQYGDGEDRWRTTHLQVSALIGPDWTGRAPTGFGDLLELRGRAELLTPSNLEAPEPDDRAYAAVATFGLHSHFSRGAYDLRVGADLVFIGPQTGLDDLQATIHNQIPGQADPSVAQETQLGNTTRIAFSGEAARAWRFGSRTRLRPFVEARTGDEVFVRAGADLIVGSFGQDGLMLREATTGHLYDGLPGDGRGLSVILGADIASVADSVYLPDGREATLSPTRSRARLGLHWQSERFVLQYGFTWLGTEFDEQPEDQLLGSASIQFRF